MEDYTYDYINGTDIYLYQHKKMFRINTDTALLAQFMKVKKGERVLDIGTNNGALLLAAHRYAPSYLYGIDIQPEAIAVAEKNMEHHHITNVVLAYTLKQHRLEIRTLQFVYDANREEAVSVLVEAVKDGRVNAHVLLPQIIER